MDRRNSKFVIEPFSTDIPSLNDSDADMIPPADSKVWNRVYQHNPIQVHIEYSLKNPEVGIYFRDTPVPHVFSWSCFFSGKQEETLCNGTRTWLPCIDTDLERCLWELEFIVPTNFSVQASGELVKEHMSLIDVEMSPRSRAHPHKAIHVFRSSLPLAASSIGFVAGAFKEKIVSPTNHLYAAIDHSHPYMLSYCVCHHSHSFVGSGVVEKAVHFLSTVFSHESITTHAILPSTSFVFVHQPPEPYCVCKNLVIVDRDLLIGERV